MMMMMMMMTVSCVCVFIRKLTTMTYLRLINSYINTYIKPILSTQYITSQKISQKSHTHFVITDTLYYVANHRSHMELL